MEQTNIIMPSWLNHQNWNSKRWKTSLTRTKLSVPAKIFSESLDKTSSILDFGCGRGKYDVFNLIKQGYTNVSGFDPYYYSNHSLLNNSYDNVYLTYVINVIENPVERLEVIKYCWEKCLQTLCVAVRTDGVGEFYTKSGTYQKFYSTQSFTNLIDEALSGELYSIIYNLDGNAIIKRVQKMYFQISLF